MNRVGRKPQGATLVESLTGSAHAKQRMTLFIETIKGEYTVEQACEELEICQSRFFAHRSDWMQQALHLLEPRTPGRPNKSQAIPSLEEVEALRQRVRELEARAAAVELQAELARTMPHVLRRGSLKKTRAPARHGKRAPQPTPPAP